MKLDLVIELVAPAEDAQAQRLSIERMPHLEKLIARSDALAASAGSPDRLLMTLFWLRAYTTYSVLGALYNLNKTTVEENLKNVIHTLGLMTCFSFERPQPGIPKLRSVQEVIDAFPDVLLVMDAQEHTGPLA